MLLTDLKEYALFRHCDPATLRLFGQHSEERTAGKGETLFFQGDPCPGILLIETGTVRLTVLATGGKEHVLRMLGPGDTAGEVLVAGGGASPATAQVTADLHYQLIPTAVILEAMDQDHAFCQTMVAALADRVHNLLHLLHDLVLRDAVGRVASYFLDHQSEGGQVCCFSSKKDLALHLNLTPETLSRAIKGLREQGLLTQDRGCLQVIDRTRLAGLCR